MGNFVLGLDIGTSSVKACLWDLERGEAVGHATSPTQDELPISGPHPEWAEQNPDLWWEHATYAIGMLRTGHAQKLSQVRAIGIAYQMHGLVLIDSEGKPVRPSIIWCDSRAVSIGERAFESLGREHSLRHGGNSPANFTASKLAWVKENEPESYQRSKFFMLPGDYVALKLTGTVGTTQSGLSEGVLWDYQQNGVWSELLDHLNIDGNLIPPVTKNLSIFSTVRSDVARELGVSPDAVVSYRSGDQPSNALALGVLNPGEIAANAGTSGVLYGVTDRLGFDERSRVNNFLHVNHTEDAPRIGILMCVNGTGCFMRWVRHQCGSDLTYSEIDSLAESVPVGSGGLLALPYGNGAERTLDNTTVGAAIVGIDLNRHTHTHIFRAAQEGIVFSFFYGLEIMRAMGLNPAGVRAGDANMFKSSLFRRSFASLANVPLELFATDGSEGAARGAALGAGLITPQQLQAACTRKALIEPEVALTSQLRDTYGAWSAALKAIRSRLVD